MLTPARLLASTSAGDHRLSLAHLVVFQWDACGRSGFRRTYRSRRTVSRKPSGQSCPGHVSFRSTRGLVLPARAGIHRPLLLRGQSYNSNSSPPFTLLFAPGEADTLRMITRTQKTSYVCRDCGHSTPKWVGQCSRCEAWNSVEEASASPPVGGPAGIHRNSAHARLTNLATPVALSEIDVSARDRAASGIVGFGMFASGN